MKTIKGLSVKEENKTSTYRVGTLLTPFVKGFFNHATKTLKSGLFKESFLLFFLTYVQLSQSEHSSV